MVTAPGDQKITYTTMSVDQSEAFNLAYESALSEVMSQLGKDYPAYIGGKPRTVAEPRFEDRSPADANLLVGRFEECGQAEADASVAAAQSAFQSWSHTRWQERVAILRNAADIIRERKFEMSAWLTVEAGKPRLEAMGEVEEAADLIEIYCSQMEQHKGYVIRLNQLSPQEVNHSVLRPYGVWAVISPFNFPVALLTGMIAGALVAGNTVVFKPSENTPLSGLNVYGCLRDAGIPDGAVNVVTGRGNDIGEALSGHPGVSGLAFIGSEHVGMQIYREFGREYPRPCIAEMGGKNPVIVTRRADLDKAVEGTARAAFGFSGQKCSAASRLYVENDIADDLWSRLVQRTRELSVGNPIASDVFMGPVIRESAYVRFQQSVERANRDGKILTGGQTLTEGSLARGYYCAPTIALLDKDHPFFAEELFVPLLATTVVSSLEEALELANRSKYGLTAGIFTEDPAERDMFLDRMEAGVIYVNRKSGATTGAWPGVQSFGGWKASGSTGKCALGPYYVQQFMREQNQTVVAE